MKIKIIGSYIIDTKDWYSNEKLTKKQKLKRISEDFEDIEVFSNHINYKTLSVEIKEL